MNDQYSELEEIIGYCFRDISLLARALTHASDSKQKLHNERMEFLGDRVLGLVIAEHLFFHDELYPVGAMAQHLSFLVSRRLCAEVSRELDLLPYAFIARSISVNHPNNFGVHANLCEALIAALYLDGGLIVARHFIEQSWKKWLTKDFSDSLTKSSKNALQEFSQSLGGDIPEYSVISCLGPDHAPKFIVEVHVETLGKAQGEGSSRQLAEKQAAKHLLNRIDYSEQKKHHG